MKNEEPKGTLERGLAGCLIGAAKLLVFAGFYLTVHYVIWPSLDHDLMVGAAVVWALSPIPD